MRAVGLGRVWHTTVGETGPEEPGVLIVPRAVRPDHTCGSKVGIWPVRAVVRSAPESGNGCRDQRAPKTTVRRADAIVLPCSALLTMRLIEAMTP